MILRFSFVVYLILAVALYCYPQTNSHIVISGKITDQETGEHLPYATIGIMGTAIGVVSNKSGQFSINIPKAHLGDSLLVSMFGYHRIKMPIKDLSANEHFKLKQQVFELDEILISAKDKKLTGDDVWKLARKNQRSNLPDDDYSLTTFFRETYQLNGQYFKLLEAAATIYGRSFPRAKKDVFIDEIRLLRGVDVSLPLSIGKDYNPFREFQGTTNRLPNRKACANCSYEIKEYIANDNGLLAKITSKQSSPDFIYCRRFTYLIDMDNYAVLQFEFEAMMPFGQGFPETLDSTYNSSLTYLKRRVDYSKYEDKYYLNQYHQHIKHEYRAIESSEKYTSEHQFYLIANNVNPNVELQNEPIDKMNYRSKLESNVQEFNEEFWANYNILLQTPQDEKIINDLEEAQSDNTQLNDN